MIETVKMENDNFRLSCSLFELIEIWSMRQAEVDIKFIDANKDEQLLHGKILDVYSRNGLEQIKFTDDIIIPTKNIITINDTKFKDYMK